MSEIDSSLDSELAYAVHSVAKYLPMSAEKRLEFQQATNSDSQLKSVMAYVNSKWPSNKNSVPIFVQPFYKIKEFLVNVDGLLLFNNNLIVPFQFSQEM